MNTLLIIYAIGFIASYYLFKYYMTRDDLDWTWGDVPIALMVGILSWVGVLTSCLSIIVSIWIEDRGGDRGGKPPKWL